MPRDIEQLAADTIRVLSIDAIQRANSGHPGMPMGMADLAVVLWSEFLTLDPVCGLVGGGRRPAIVTFMCHGAFTSSAAMWSCRGVS